MKVSKKTKNMRFRFFRVISRKLSGVFGDPTLIAPAQDHSSDEVAYIPPTIYTQPASRKQGVKGKQP